MTTKQRRLVEAAMVYIDDGAQHTAKQRLEMALTEDSEMKLYSSKASPGWGAGLMMIAAKNVREADEIVKGVRETDRYACWGDPKFVARIPDRKRSGVLDKQLFIE